MKINVAKKNTGCYFAHMEGEAEVYGAGSTWKLAVMRLLDRAPNDLGEAGGAKVAADAVAVAASGGDVRGDFPP